MCMRDKTFADYEQPHYPLHGIGAVNNEADKDYRARYNSNLLNAAYWFANCFNLHHIASAICNSTF